MRCPHCDHDHLAEAAYCARCGGRTPSWGANAVSLSGTPTQAPMAAHPKSESLDAEDASRQAIIEGTLLWDLQHRLHGGPLDAAARQAIRGYLASRGLPDVSDAWLAEQWRAMAEARAALAPRAAEGPWAGWAVRLAVAGAILLAMAALWLAATYYA